MDDRDRGQEVREEQGVGGGGGAARSAAPPPASLAVAAPAFGVGLRGPHAEEIARDPGAVDWLEIVSDPYLGVGGPRRALLERVRGLRPVAMHGVGLSIAGTEPLDAAYLAGLRELAAWLEPAFVSDHLCWTAIGGRESHDLLPIAHTEEVLRHVAGRVARVQERLGRRLLLENPTAYVAFRESELDEAELLAALCRETGCGVLLDLNNLLVNAHNLGTDPRRALELLPRGAVGYFHLAGHAVLSDVRIDTHDAPVPDPVWELFDAAVRRFPEAGAIVERDDALPAYAELVAEAARARDRHAALTRGDAEAAPAAPIRPRAADLDAGPPPERWRALQGAFFERIVDRPLGFEHADLEGFLDGSLPVRAARGLRVYSDAYAASLRGALATNFPALARAVCGDDFDRLAAAYLRAHPPCGPGFVGLGAQLAEFVRGYAFGAEYAVPREALADLAALEQAELEAQDAPDAARALSPVELAALEPEHWEEMRFAFAPCLRLVRCRHDVAPALRAVAAGEDPPLPTPGEVAYRVARAGAGVRTEPLSPLAASLLELLLAGRRFAAACADAGGAHAAAPEAVARAAAELLVDAAARGLLARADA